MKTNTCFSILLSLSILTLGNRLQAQDTITTSDMPIVGLTIMTDEDTTNLPSSGNASKIAPQTWNFGSLISQKVSTVTFVSPGSTKYSSFYPSSNLADSTYGTDGYTFLYNSPSSFSVNGMEVTYSYMGYNFGIHLNLNPEYIQTNLPATIGSIVGGVSSGVQKFAQTILIIDSEEVNVTITYHDTVDAYGTMKLPNGKFNVLRQKRYSLTNEQLLIHTNGKWAVESSTNTKSYEYDWYAKDVGYTLAQMNMDTSTGTMPQNVIWDASAVGAGVEEISHSGNTTIFPNPCTTKIEFRSTENYGQHILIYDVTGRKVAEQVMNNGFTTINTSRYAKGLYLYTVTDLSGKVIDNGKFSVQ